MRVSAAPADLRLFGAALASWLAAGWAVGTTAASAATVAFCVAAGGAGCLARARGRQGRHRAWLVAGAMAATASALVLVATTARLVVREAGPLPGWVRERAVVTAEVGVVSDPNPVRANRPGEQRWSMKGSLEHAAGRGQAVRPGVTVVVIADRAISSAKPGERWRVTGQLQGADPGEDVSALLSARAPPIRLAEAGAVQRGAEVLRAGLRNACTHLASDPRGLLPGLVVGDTSRQPDDLTAAMQATGLTHLVAVSGSNVAIICGAVLLLCARLGVGMRLRLLSAGAALGGFLILARPDPSVLRATVMGTIALLGIWSGRRGRGIPALAAAIVLLLAVDPWLARSYGFALSSLATAGLLLFAGPWGRELTRWMPRPFAFAISVPLAAQVICGPVLVLLQPVVNVVAVPANLLAAPAVAPATILGVAASMVAPWWPWGGTLLAELGGRAAGWIAVVARRGAAVPAGSLPWPGGAGGAVLLALATAAAILVLPVALSGLTRAVAALGRAVGSRGGAVGSRGRAPRAPRQPRWWVSGLTGSAAGLVAVGLVAGGAVPWPAALPRLASTWPPVGWWIVSCDVGQGDAAVVSTGVGRALLVDAGPDPAAVDRCLSDLGVRQLDLVVLTHYHADHIDGLPGALNGRRAGGVLVTALSSPDDGARRVRSWAGSAGLTPEIARIGQSGELGGTTWLVLAAAPDQPGTATGADDHRSSPGGKLEEGSAPNNASVVLLLQRQGVRALMTGDIEPEAQARVRRALLTLPGGPQIDVLKVAHHGSAKQDPELHQVMQPRVALISVGQGNDYGHPAARTLAMLTALRARVLRTDQQGALAAVLSPRGLATATQRGRRMARPGRGVGRRTGLAGSARAFRRPRGFWPRGRSRRRPRRRP